MGRKRLQHAADILCQMFCGWRLVNSYRELERLGSGTLVIDALTEVCTFDGQPIERLPIAGELRAWLEQDLPENGVQIAELREAALTAELRFGWVARGERGTRVVHFDPGGDVVAPARFLVCEIECRSRVAT